jgi:hypothetical protein
MKIHMWPPVPPMLPAPPPKSLPTALQLELRTEELSNVSQQQQTRLKKLSVARWKPRGLDEDDDPDSEKCKQNCHSHRDIDFLV